MANRHFQPQVKHPALNTTFNGVVHPFSAPDAQVHQYRGIKFATVPARFRRSVLNKKYPDVYDATWHGPACPQAQFPQKFEDILSGVPRPNISETGLDFPFVFDEFECLNLVITTPASANAGDELPVMVYIHGGGNVVGDASSWFNDGGVLVAESMRLGKPVIVVGVNYRLNAFGWVASEALKEDNEEAGDLGVGNYGAYDVRLALQWIHDHITPFGGSPSRITIFGESAGGWNVDYQISSRLPAYHTRAILQSGTANGSVSSEPLQLSESGHILGKIMAASNSTTIDDLRSLQANDLLAAWITVSNETRATWIAMPTIDGVFIDENWRQQCSFAEGPNNAVMVGDCENEGAIIGMLAAVASKPDSKPPLSTLIHTLQTSIPESTLTRILATYSIGTSSTPEEIKFSLFDLFGDLCFSYPTHASIAKFRSQPSLKHSYRYAFNQPNGFGGFLQGTANHALDLYYVFAPPQVFEASSSKEADLKIQKKMQGHWIAFANGKKPWEGGEDAVFSYGGGEGGKEISADDVGSVRRVNRWEVFEELGVEQRMKLSEEVAVYVYQL